MEQDEMYVYRIISNLKYTCVSCLSELSSRPWNSGWFQQIPTLVARPSKPNILDHSVNKMGRSLHVKFNVRFHISWEKVMFSKKRHFSRRMAHPFFSKTLLIFQSPPFGFLDQEDACVDRVQSHSGQTWRFAHSYTWHRVESLLYTSQAKTAGWRFLRSALIPSHRDNSHGDGSKKRFIEVNETMFKLHGGGLQRHVHELRLI